MVVLDRMARVTHNGAESGHQLPLEDGPCAPWNRTRWNALRRPLASGSIRLPPCTHAQPACAWHAPCSFMHAWCRGATRGYEYSCIIQRYRTLSSWRRRGLLCYCAQCPSVVDKVLQLFQKEAEAHLKQLEFALSTGHLVPRLKRGLGG